MLTFTRSGKTSVSQSHGSAGHLGIFIFSIQTYTALYWAIRFAYAGLPAPVNWRTGAGQDHPLWCWAPYKQGLQLCSVSIAPL